MGFLKFLIRGRLKACCKRIQEKGVNDAAELDDHHHGSRPISEQSGGGGGGGRGGSSVKEFNWEEMKRVTRDFSKVIGLGGFSTVYLAKFPNSGFRAVKVVHGSNCSERLNRIYKQELEILLRVSHPNIVALFGYCDDEREDGGVLVFDYAPNGNLQEKLRGDAEKIRLLPWKKRVLIAYQLARGMEYLHEKSGLQIVHGDIKAANILLDEKLNCKLCDFGSAKMGFASTVLPPSTSRMDRMIMGSEGYMDPHYLKTGVISKKNDIYSFGVIVLELVTGIAASELSRERILAAGTTDKDVPIDPSLEKDGGFDAEEAKAMTFISSMCLCHTPTLRPSATQIIASMRDKIHSISHSRQP